MSNIVKRLIFIFFIGLIVLLVYEQFGTTSDRQNISYTAFKREVQSKNVQSVTFHGKEVTGEYSTPRTVNQKDYTNFRVVIPTGSEERVVKLLEDNNVEVSAESQEQSWWSMLLVNSLPILLIIGIWLYFIYRTRQSMGGGGMLGVGDSPAKLYDEETPEVTFEDVAGYKGPKNEVTQVIEFLKNPGKFDRLGGEIPRGVLMMGPPGTGKTLMARAIAGEAGVPFLSTSGSDFMEMFVGVGASRVRDLFERAKEVAPSIIFIDEIDSVGRKRGAGVGGGHDEREQTLNQLLNEMDGFEPNAGVILIAATNRPDILDDALMRPGRFDRQVTFDLPTVEERKGILETHAKNKPLGDDVDLDRIAKGTPGFSGADLRNLLNEAALLAAEQGRDTITREAIEEARDKVMMGLRREEMVISDDEKRTMAVHETGHTLAAHYTEGADPVHKVTIIPRGRALGATQQMPLEEKKMYTQEDLMGRLAVMMGGRAAEELKNQSVTNGAQDDLRRATKLARKMVLQWGMSPDLGNLAYQDGDGNVFLGEEMAQKREYSEQTAEKIDKAVRDIIDEATEKARGIMREHEDEMDQLVEVLMEKETLSAEEIKSLLQTGELPGNGEKPSPDGAPADDDSEPSESPEEQASEEPVSTESYADSGQDLSSSGNGPAPDSSEDMDPSADESPDQKESESKTNPGSRHDFDEE